MSKYPYSLLTAEHFHAVDLATCKQTLAESEIEYSVDMGCFTIHHGIRWGAPIVIAEHHDQKTDELSGVWYDEARENNRKADNA